MSGFATKSLIAAAALAAGIFAAPLTASAGGYGYGGGYSNGGYYDTYEPVHYVRCFYKKVRYYDEYYGYYRVKRVRVCR